ncbi:MULTISPECIES: NUDIX hydrolase [Haloarcula]|uniref:Coenzyme A pyrophosphatase n=1 Tax=Haloarcula pellucida TaxID=1427151 RepID=A0A830GGH5_9EURY|nr:MULTISPECIES: CoA pyrophosphatase [Halomicroarcula]MBX0346740.1 CoA pyrophosphatase [Halomicroarcula pellucida]MDS0277403.1 CoA pyrophosphatase [Halomicroarcula sp. S1AR25-4]QIO22221.1 CoA pyrophosphatase [Haloarcula sp. JP-L23]GGN85297.1 coenzyme A pyrophosphatase [Halomicroarcula pellucida]
MDFDRLRAHDAVVVDDEEREAAVVVPVVTRPEGEGILFTKRADHLPDHPGQMSFPGGGYEPEDDDLLRTALREANEEIGLDPQAAHVVGRLDDIRTVSHYSVRPFVARIPDREYTPSDEEVAEVVVLPVSELTDLDNYESEHRDHPYYGEIRLHFFYVDGYTVWGATARMLVQLLELATDWEMPPEPDRYAGPDDEFPESVRDQIR